MSRTAAVDLPADVDAFLVRWRPSEPVNETLFESLLPTARAWVSATAPTNNIDAGQMMRSVTGLLMWAHTKIGTVDPATVLDPDNVELWVMVINKHRKPHWLRMTRAALRQVGRAVQPDSWPAVPKPIKRTPAATAYDASEEQTFKLLAGLFGRRNRAARLWVTAASLGAGLSGPEIAVGCVDDVVEVGDRLVIQVGGRNTRLAPVRREWTDMVVEAVQAVEAVEAVEAAKQTTQPDDAMSGRFIEVTCSQGAYSVASRLAPINGEPLSISRARATWLTAHLKEPARNRGVRGG